MPTDAHVVLATSHFDDDFRVLTDELGFRVDAIRPADSPRVAVVSAHGVRLRLERSAADVPLVIHLATDDDHAGHDVTLPGGSALRFRPRSTPLFIPENAPSIVMSENTGLNAPGRAGMRYRDLLPGRWGGRFIASHISIPDGGLVPDYVHFHKIRFQLIFVKAGWVKVVYQDQGEPFVMHAGDGVLQPPEIRHRVLEASPGLEVIEIGCPADHETIADWACPLPTDRVDPERDFGGQRFVRHVAAEATYSPWRLDGWEHRDTGIGDATVGLAGVRVARPTSVIDAYETAHNTEFAMLVVLTGSVEIALDGRAVRMSHGDSVAIPANTRYRLSAPTADCELLDVTLPATFDVHR